jgi:hypothetical protein
MKKRIFPVALALFIAFALLPQPALASSDGSPADHDHSGHMHEETLWASAYEIPVYSSYYIPPDIDAELMETIYIEPFERLDMQPTLDALASAGGGEGAPLPTEELEDQFLAVISTQFPSVSDSNTERGLT